MLTFFDDLGLTILRHWRRADLNAAAFPEIATAALVDRPPSTYVDPMEVVRWLHETPTLVPQADIDSKFGQPVITVFRSEGFFIDVLFWVDGTTAIHQHRFSGAFHVLEGSSLQSTYRFTERHRYSERLLAGDLDLLDVELLTRGAVRPIRAGSDLIHSLFHLDRPSVSVVVRTPSDDCAGPQYSYSRAGLAHDPFATSESATRKIQTLDLLHALGRPEFELLARAAVQNADSFLAFQVLAHLVKRFESERYVAFLESLRPAHARLVDRMSDYAEEQRRDDYIIARRRLAKRSEHRFFLALLLNLPSRAHVFNVVRSAFPGAEPAAAVHRWLGEMAKLDAIHAWVTDVARPRGGDAVPILDVGLNERDLQIVRHMLDGLADAAIGERFEGTVSSAEVVATCKVLRDSLLLRPLFVQ